MRIINTLQGSSEWHAIRAKRFTASEAAAACGDHKYMTRDDLLKQKATGITPEVSEHQQRIFDQGHAFEEMARHLAEEIISEDLFPCTCEDDTGTYLASMDGLNMDATIGFEHKTINAALRNATSETLEEHYKWQMDHQMMVTGAERILFMASDGTKDDCNWFWYERDEDRIKRLIAHWEQFAQDLATYEPPAPQVEAVGVSPESLPALSVQVTGMVTASNLDAFRDHALAVINSINTDLQSDQDFVDAEKAVKWCKDVEDRLTATKAQVLGQMADIDQICRTLDSISETTRAKRLMLDKLVKTQKEARRTQIVTEAKMAWQDYMKGLNAQFDVVRLDLPVPDFATAIKGKKTLSSIQSACNDLLAKSKIEAMEKADLYRANLKVFAELAENHGFLFRNLQALVDQPSQAFEAIVKTTIADYEAQQKAKREAEMKRMEEEAKAKAEAEREKIRREEQAKAEAEAQRKAAEERAREQASHVAASKMAEIPITKTEPAKPTMLEAEAQRLKACENTSQVKPDSRSQAEIDIACWLFDNTGITQRQAGCIANDIVSGRVPHVVVRTQKVVNA
jgi:putative phage-type endonuclease